jgi:hypothetical protein
MPKSWAETDRALKGQRAGIRMLLQSAGVAMVKYRYQGQFICAELLDGAGKLWGDVPAQHADNLRHIAASQLSANPGGVELWQRSAGVLEWILNGDITISFRNYPGSDHDLVMGQDLRELASAVVEQHRADESEAERPRVFA